MHVQVMRNVSEFDRRAEGEAAELEWQRRKIGTIAAIVRSIEPKRRGADVGCGTGLMTLEYAKAGIESIDGFDISPECLRAAANRGISTHLWNADGSLCPVDDASYDIVIVGDLVEHLLDTEMFMCEIFRIVAPGGSVIISTPNLVSWYNRLRVLRGRVPVGAPGVSPTVRADPFVDNNHLRVSVIREWEALFVGQGFAVERIAGCAGHFETWRGGGKIGAFKAVSRAVERWPSLADLLLFVLRKPAS
jgi:2-polyprenyl-3-methyl-5-hydroxy-6-metoxy-1,4-benzoquinol methylase